MLLGDCRGSFPPADPFAGYDEIVWDGSLHSYRPAPGWRASISPSLPLYTEIDEHLDPVTFEVLRNRLWTINVAHGETLIRISGSPIFQAFDFNMVIMAEDGEAIMNAPFIQYLNSGAPIAVAYTLENYSDSPGIEEGDIFIATDPWIGASHQMDVCIFGPVFVEGKLFGWVSNAAHQYDLGGIVPGGWPQNAVDVYSDPAVLRPFKIVEKGVLRKDLEQMYRRQSRMPDLLAFDLRAQLAGVRYAVKAIADSCVEFGAPTVKAAMRRILDQAQEAFADKLRRIPDGSWSDVRYVDENLPGERTTNRIQLNVEKTGDRLVVAQRRHRRAEARPHRLRLHQLRRRLRRRALGDDALRAHVLDRRRRPADRVPAAAGAPHERRLPGGRERVGDEHRHAHALVDERRRADAA